MLFFYMILILVLKVSTNSVLHVYLFLKVH